MKSFDGYKIPKMKPSKFWIWEKHSLPAQRKGWDLFEVCGGECDGELQIQVLQAPEDNPDLRYKRKKFKDDKSAAEFVEEQAFLGDAVCQAAIKELRYQGMPDIKRFKLTKRIKSWKKPAKMTSRNAAKP